MGFQCSECGRVVDSGDALPRRGPICFGCHVRGVGFTFRGASYGRSAFNQSTVGEMRRDIEASAAAQGRVVEPVGSRWV